MFGNFLGTFLRTTFYICSSENNNRRASARINSNTYLYNFKPVSQRGMGTLCLLIYLEWKCSESHRYPTWSVVSLSQYSCNFIFRAAFSKGTPCSTQIDLLRKFLYRPEESSIAKKKRCAAKKLIG